MYIIYKITSFYKGACKITKETLVNSNGSWADVERILAMPESYDGERKEAMDDLTDLGITEYHHYSISQI